MIRLAFAVFRKDLRLSMRSNGLCRHCCWGYCSFSHSAWPAALPAFCRRKRRLRSSGWLPFLPGPDLQSAIRLRGRTRGWACGCAFFLFQGVWLGKALAVYLLLLLLQAVFCRPLSFSWPGFL